MVVSTLACFLKFLGTLFHTALELQVINIQKVTIAIACSNTTFAPGDSVSKLTRTIRNYDMEAKMGRMFGTVVLFLTVLDVIGRKLGLN
jgi:hypothetical protein